MAGKRHVGVIDIGKTNAKVASVDLEAMRETGVLTTPNTVRRDGPYPHYDIERLWAFLLDGLAEVNRAAPIEALVVTTHGASGVLLDGDGGLAFPVLDYEHPGPDALAAAYDAVRPGFEETGSPRLPLGMNLGAQVFWQLETFPEMAARVAWVVTYPQYWVSRLTGRFATRRDLAGVPYRSVGAGGGGFFVAGGPAGAQGADGAGASAGGRDRDAAAGGRGADRDRRRSAGAGGDPRFQRVALSASPAAAGAVRGGVDRDLGDHDGDRRAQGGARSGAGHADQRECAGRSGAVGAVHGRARVRAGAARA